jgi:hypothetical protein
LLDSAENAAENDLRRVDRAHRRRDRYPPLLMGGHQRALT